MGTPLISGSGGRASGIHQNIFLTMIQQICFFPAAWSSNYFFHFHFGIISTISWRQLFTSTVGSYKLFILPSSCLKLFISKTFRGPWILDKHHIYSPAAISGHRTIQTRKPPLSYQAPTHLLLGLECTCGQSALPKSTTSEHNSVQPGITAILTVGSTSP